MKRKCKRAVAVGAALLSMHIGGAVVAAAEAPTTAGTGGAKVSLLHGSQKGADEEADTTLRAAAEEEVNGTQAKESAPPAVEVALHGYMQQSMEKKFDAGPGQVSYWFAKELYIRPEVAFKKSEGDWKVKASFVTKWGTNREHGINHERLMEDNLYNGDMARDENMRPEYYYIEGMLGKMGQFVKLGNFQPWVQMGYVFSGNILGLSLDHWGDGYATHVFGGVLDVANGDLATGAQPTYDNAAGNWMPEIRQIWSDNTRAHESFKVVTVGGQQHLSRDGVNALPADEERHLLENGGTGSDNALSDLSNPWNPGKNTTKKVFGVAVDKRLSPRLDASLGYYYYKSAAYNRKPLHIGALTLNYKLRDKLNLQAIYAQGNQHGPNSNPRGFMIDLMYGGNPWLPVGKAGEFGAYIGYHYLAPDSFIKCAYGDDIDKGQKGLAMGVFYNLTKSVQISVKYGTGSSLTNNGAKRRKLYTSIAAYF